VQDWAKQAHLKNYYEWLHTRYKDFLIKNPKFAQIFKEYLERENQPIQMLLPTP
jgi:hypothetical protein